MPDTQILLENEKAILYPLRESDLDDLYKVASDPGIWEQHPNKDRWKKEFFVIFFEGAIQSQGAYKIVDKITGNIIGSTRFYEYDPEDNSIFIGYTFYAKAYWGKGYNVLVKTTMLDYIFQFVSNVYFHIGSGNIRSQIAISRLGAKKIGEELVPYYGESPRLNFTYKVNKESWRQKNPGKETIDSSPGS